MSSNGNWQQKLEEIEAKINRAVASSQQSDTKTVKPHLEVSPSPQVRQWIESGKSWFKTLPQVGKIAVGIGVVWLSFSILNAFLHIVSTLIGIAVMGLILYLGYKFVVKS